MTTRPSLENPGPAPLPNRLNRPLGSQTLSMSGARGYPPEVANDERAVACGLGDQGGYGPSVGMSRSMSPGNKKHHEANIISTSAAGLNLERQQPENHYSNPRQVTRYHSSALETARRGGSIDRHLKHPKFLISQSKSWRFLGLIFLRAKLDSAVVSAV
jgi:hypothetical protein